MEGTDGTVDQFALINNCECRRCMDDGAHMIFKRVVEFCYRSPISPAISACFRDITVSRVGTLTLRVLKYLARDILILIDIFILFI